MAATRSRTLWVGVPCLLLSLCLSMAAVVPLRPRGAPSLAVSLPVLFIAAALSMLSTATVGRSPRDSGGYDLKGVPYAAAALLLGPVLIIVVAVASDVFLAPRLLHSRSRWRWTTAAVTALTASCAGVTFRAVSPEGLTAPIDGFGGARLAVALAAATAVALVVHELLWTVVLRLLSPGDSRVSLAQSPAMMALAVAQVACGLLTAMLWVRAPALLVLSGGLYLGLWVALSVFRAQWERDRDAKTGVLNAVAFGAAAQRELARAARGDGSVSLLAADVDQLKTMNSTLGHVRADAVIASVANILTVQSREYDLVGRFGGDEFVIVLPDTGIEAATALAERIRAAVHVSEARKGAGPSVGTLSIGVCQWRPGETYEELLAAADREAYIAKNAGRNRVHARAENAVHVLNQRAADASPYPAALP